MMMFALGFILGALTVIGALAVWVIAASAKVDGE